MKVGVIMKKTDYGVLKQVIYHEIEQEMAKKKAGTTHTEPFDINIYNKGMDWYNSGLTLEEAPDNDKNNIHFVNGYERAKRLARFEEMKNSNDKHR